MPKSRHNDVALRKSSAMMGKADGKPDASAMARSVEMSIISGPIPSADELAKYDAIVPGAAERFLYIHERQITLLETQAEHRRNLETSVVLGDGKRAWAGLFIGVFVVGLFAYCGYSLAIKGHDALAGVVFTTAIAAPVGAFVHGTNSRRAERKDRLKALTQGESTNQTESPTD